MDYWKSVLFVILGACCYGILSTMVKLAYDQGFQPGQVTGSQMMFGVIILSIFNKIKNGWVKLSPRQWISLMLAGMFVGLTGICYYTALQYIPASIAIVLLFQFTWIGVLVHACMEKRLPSLQKGISLVFLFIGTLLAGKMTGASMGDLPVLGIGLGLLAALFYAGFIAASGRIAVEINPWMRSLLMSIGSFLTACIVFPPQFLVDGSLRNGLWLWGGLLALFGIVLPNLLFTYGVPQVGGGLATILSSAELPVAVVMSWWVLGEPVTFLQWIGVLIILVGILVAEMPSKKGKWQAQ